LIDANGFLLPGSEFNIFLSHASAKPYHLFKKEAWWYNKNITEVKKKKKKKKKKKQKKKNVTKRDTNWDFPKNKTKKKIPTTSIDRK
jgi:hypothetical protein